MFPDAVIALAEEVLASYQAAGLRLATAESCTGGLIAGCLTAVAGSSRVFERGFVTYSNAAKTELLGVPEALLRDYGAVSAEVAAAMAAGALAHSRAEAAVSVTGIAGPDGGTPTKPVGLVFIGFARKGNPPMAERHVFGGGRADIRLAAVAAALTLAREQCPCG